MKSPKKIAEELVNDFIQMTRNRNEKSMSYVRAKHSAFICVNEKIKFAKEFLPLFDTENLINSKIEGLKEVQQEINKL